MLATIEERMVKKILGHGKMSQRYENYEFTASDAVAGNHICGASISLIRQGWSIMLAAIVCYISVVAKS